jgi:hypothetical protein
MPMAEPTTNCTTCGSPILQRTADRNGGICAICLRDANSTRDEREYEVDSPDPIAVEIDFDLSTLQDSDGIVWKNVENALFLIASEYVQAFGSVHRDKTFYAFAFDCNADYAQVFVCANTRAALKTRATDYKHRRPDLYGHLTIQDLEDKLRWGLGDWGFQSFTTEGFSDAWEPIEELLLDAIPWDDDNDQRIEDFRTSFMESACRCMIRLESEGTLDALPKTEDFKTFVADHDESDETSWRRYEAVRSRESRA